MDPNFRQRAGGLISPGDSLSGKTTTSIQGELIAFGFADCEVHVNDSTLINSDIECVDGLIHAVDTDLLPPSMKSEEACGVN